MCRILPLGKLVRWDVITARHKGLDLGADGLFKCNVLVYTRCTVAQLVAKVGESGDGAGFCRLEESFA